MKSPMRGAPNENAQEINMKSSIGRQTSALVAPILFLICTVAWAAPMVQAESRALSSIGLMHEAQRLNDEGSLAEATPLSRAAMEASRESGDNIQLDAGTLLVNLLHKQGRYVEARIAAEEQISYWEQQAAFFGQTLKGDTRVMRQLGLAIEASTMAGDQAEVTRLQESLFAIGNPYPPLWQLSTDEPRLHYELADFSVPLVLGHWKLTAFEPAHTREIPSRLRYTQVLPDGILSAEIFLSYDELQRLQDAAQRQEWRVSYQQISTASALASAMPDLPFAGVTFVKIDRQWGCDGAQCVGVNWLVRHGDWRMEIEATFPSEDRAHAAEQLHKLFGALKWRTAPPLFRDRSMAEQIRNMESSWKVAGGWRKSAELATQALPDAYFPDEIMRLHTYIGVSQYRHGAMDAARRSLDLALSGQGHHSFEEDLYQVALDHAADIAYRQGRDHEAVALNRILMDRQSGATAWHVPDNKKALFNVWSDVQLPLRVGEYRLRQDSENRFFYENLQTGARLGLTVALPQSSDEDLEQVMRSFLAKNLQLQSGDVRKTEFSPKSAKQKTTGRKWEFDVTQLPGEKAISEEDFVTGVLLKAPKKMVFWIVNHEGRLSLLRAPILNDGQSATEANQIAQALSW
ncbi:hypothetical protein [Pseudomonas sp. EA_5y_Pfl2_R50]|uniref:hypothetical protein n=1 Tax=Pseudomonas sp. EA_5y_Pfl2_R50 TaxID=3088691 RepID=UPI0030DABD2B